jgi:hypothetical protein
MRNEQGWGGEFGQATAGYLNTGRGRIQLRNGLRNREGCTSGVAAETAPELAATMHSDSSRTCTAFRFTISFMCSCKFLMVLGFSSGSNNADTIALLSVRRPLRRRHAAPLKSSEPIYAVAFCTSATTGPDWHLCLGADRGRENLLE